MKKIEKLTDKDFNDFSCPGSSTVDKLNEIIDRLNQDCPVDTVVDYKPKMEQKYLYVDKWGDKMLNTWTDSRIDNHLLFTSNCFTVEADCDKYLEYTNALKTITEFKLKNGLTWKPDRRDVSQRKYYITVYENTPHIGCKVRDNEFNLLGYYPTREDAQKVADCCKAEILIVAAY